MRKGIIVFIICLLLLLVAIKILTSQYEKVIPNCYNDYNWASQTAEVNLINRGFIEKEEPTTITPRLLLSEKIDTMEGMNSNIIDIHRQIQLINIKSDTGKVFELITINKASIEECSLSDPVIILISPEIKVLDFGKYN